jgi:hypothetical protein
MANTYIFNMFSLIDYVELVKKTHRSQECIRMRSYRQLTTIIQSMRAGKSGVDKEMDHLVSIYDRIARKGSRGNS